MPSNAVELTEINPKVANLKVKDSRSFRPSSIAEINAAANYEPLTMKCGEKVIGIGCGNSVEDIGIISCCYVTLWSTLVGFYSLLLKAAVDTDDQSTALYTFLFFGVIFVFLIGGSVYTGQLELNRLKKARAVRRAEKLRQEGDADGAAEAEADASGESGI